MPRAELGDRGLYYERRGSGAPLLLIQGMAGHHALWGEPLLGRLERDFDVVTYDHRGIGDSTDVPGQFTIADLAADAADLLDRLGWDSAHVMGISMGGMIAQELVLAQPDRVRTLVLGCTYAGGAGSSLAAPGPARMVAGMNTGSAELAIRAAYEANLSPAFRADDSHFAPFKHTSLSVRVPVPLRQIQASLVHDTSERLPSVSAPTLVVHGTVDEMLLYSNGVQIARLIPGATLHTLADVGHLFWWEQPAVTADLLRRHCLAR
ncbi:MAG: alpha/beta fold hydrolase [Jatrophihabitantaceae bacterium]